MSDINIEIEDPTTEGGTSTSTAGETLRAGDTDGEEILLFSRGIELDDEKKGEVIRYLIDSQEEAEGAREERAASWDTWRRHREARPEREVVDFPWQGASNVVPPVASSNTLGVYSHIRRSILKRRPLWTAEATHRNETQRMKAFTKFLNSFAEDPAKANIDVPLKTALYDAISLGDQFVEVPWVERRLRFKRPAEDGSTIDVDRITYAGPVLLPHRIENVYARTDIKDLQDTPFIAIRHEGFTMGKLRSLERDGYFTDIDNLEAAGQEQTEDNLESSLEREGLERIDSSDEPLIDLWKGWAYIDIDDDGVPEDVIVWYHKETETILRTELNDFGVRLIANLPYFPVPYSLYNTGVGALAEHIQEEITTLHNMRINSLHIHSLQMFATKQGSDVGKRERLFPLRNIQLDNPREDLQVVTFPDVSGPTLLAEQQAKRYLDLHTGVSEAMLGMPDQTAKSGTSPSLQMFLAQQGSAILETAVESLADGLSELGFFFVLQLVKNSDSVIPHLEELVDEEDVEDVKSVLEMDIEDLPLHMRMVVKATDIQKSEDAKRQNLMALNQLYTMYGQEVMQYMQVIANPEVPDVMKEFALQIYHGKTKVMEETLELFGTKTTDDYLPYIRDVEMMLSAIEEQKRMMVEASQQQMGGQNDRMGGTPSGAPGGMGAPPGGGGGPDGPGGIGGPPTGPPAAAGGGPDGPPQAPDGGGGIPQAR